MTAVMILPQRNPLVLAKEVATLTISAAAGSNSASAWVGLKEEFEALGIPFERRGKRADEYVRGHARVVGRDGASFPQASL